MERGRLLCWECLRVADERARGWRAYRGDVPGEDPEPILLFYCPACAEREFGGPFAAPREVQQLVRMLWTAAGSSGAPPSRGRGRTVGRILRELF
ncbi:MAG TPA: hypothetical protein VGH35_00075 [Gaiellaceae bacterium]|jgi:hypothetical protein